jgi:hypothetical protein
MKILIRPGVISFLVWLVLTISAFYSWGKVPKFSLMDIYPFLICPIWLYRSIKVMTNNKDTPLIQII